MDSNTESSDLSHSGGGSSESHHDGNEVDIALLESIFHDEMMMMENNNLYNWDDNAFSQAPNNSAMNTNSQISTPAPAPVATVPQQQPNVQYNQQSQHINIAPAPIQSQQSVQVNSVSQNGRVNIQASPIRVQQGAQSNQQQQQQHLVEIQPRQSQQQIQPNPVQTQQRTIHVNQGVQQVQSQNSQYQPKGIRHNVQPQTVVHTTSVPVQANAQVHVINSNLNHHPAGNVNIAPMPATVTTQPQTTYYTQQGQHQPQPTPVTYTNVNVNIQAASAPHQPQTVNTNQAQLSHVPQHQQQQQHTAASSQSQHLNIAPANSKPQQNLTPVAAPAANQPQYVTPQQATQRQHAQVQAPSSQQQQPQQVQQNFVQQQQQVQPQQVQSQQPQQVQSQQGQQVQPQQVQSQQQQVQMQQRVAPQQQTMQSQQTRPQQGQQVNVQSRPMAPILQAPSAQVSVTHAPVHAASAHAPSQPQYVTQYVQTNQTVQAQANGMAKQQQRIVQQQVYVQQPQQQAIQHQQQLTSRRPSVTVSSNQVQAQYVNAHGANVTYMTPTMHQQPHITHQHPQAMKPVLSHTQNPTANLPAMSGAMPLSNPIHSSQQILSQQAKATNLVSQFQTLASRLGLSLPHNFLEDLTTAATQREAGEVVTKSMLQLIRDDAKDTPVFMKQLQDTAEAAISAVDSRKRKQGDIETKIEPIPVRRKKKPTKEDCEEKLKLLKEENETLKRHLDMVRNKKARFEAERHAQEKKMKELVMLSAKGDNELWQKELKGNLAQFSETYSDYGKHRRDELFFHLNQLEKLAAPTTFTKMSLWTLGQKESFFTNPNNHPISGILRKELDITPAQGRKILAQRSKIQKLCQNIEEVLQLIANLKAICQKKQKLFGDRMTKCQEILTPEQVTKLLVWIDDHANILDEHCPGWSSMRVRDSDETSDYDDEEDDDDDGKNDIETATSSESPSSSGAEDAKVEVKNEED
ncbi:hypothetical protein CTEN210_04718 [Chaetoceros tenuissimus]|uniref:Uncharacterized protein n=1 Tax=Chaetoceros tenuissimus TaxID=426638 RepID=A0AAD3H2J6_9STRA|nr:hypothetical protein CTEN210_04718 [Chaetoceros tenuissimus]